jgi:hypothetical protein
VTFAKTTFTEADLEFPMAAGDVLKTRGVRNSICMAVLVRRHLMEEVMRRLLALRALSKLHHQAICLAKDIVDAEELVKEWNELVKEGTHGNAGTCRYTHIRTNTYTYT